MEIFVIWVVLAVLVAMLAGRYDRSPVLAFFVALLLSPLLAGIGYLVAGPSQAARHRRIEEEERIRARAREKYASR